MRRSKKTPLERLKVKDKKVVLKEFETKQEQKELDLFQKLFPDCQYSLEIFRLKYQLLAYGLVKNNEYLEKYLKLISDNLTTEKTNYITQSHHSIPLSVYSNIFKADNLELNTADLRKASGLVNPEILTVNLKFTDHLLAHWYLYNCSKDRKFKKMNFICCWNGFGWLNKKRFWWFKKFQLTKSFSNTEKLNLLQETYAIRLKEIQAKRAESKKKAE